MLKLIWQPMDKAPLNKRILLCLYGPCPDSEDVELRYTITVGKWETDEYSKNPKPYWRTEANAGFKSADRRNVPAAWMPLPAAPKRLPK